MDPTIASPTTQNPYNSLVNHGLHNMPVINFNNIMNVKDSRWLQLEVCREFQRSKCTRPDTECKFAHPPSTVEVQNGRVTACYDSIKGRCNREKPPCKYFHPPQHLKDQLLINGRNHLALKNAFMTQLHSINPPTQLVHGSVPLANTPYMTLPSYSPYIGSQQVMTVGMADQVASSLGSVVPQHVVQTQKIARTDRLEAFPGVGIPYKRPAPEKSGMTVYQPGNAAYHQALMQQIGGQAYMPVSCEYGGSGSIALPPPTIELPETSPATPSVASSSQTEPPLSSSVSTLTYSCNTSASQTANPTTSSSVSGKVAALANNSSAISNGASPSAPVNVFSYAGYPINKGHRPTLKPSFIPGVSAMPAAYPTATMPGSIASMGNFAYGMAPSIPGLNFPFASNIPMFSAGTNIGSLAQAMATPNIAGMSQGVPTLSSPFMYSQYPPSSLVLPQLSALTANAQNSWAQTSEQPYKKLKTS